MANTFAKASITSEAAHQIIEAAEAKAREIDTPMVIAVCDDGGVLKAFSRMDGAALLSVQVAQDKAYTAVGFGMPTHGWHDFIKDDPPLADGAPTGIERLVVFGGGYPIQVEGPVVGGMGVSGGRGSPERPGGGRDRRQRRALQPGPAGGRGGPPGARGAGGLTRATPRRPRCRPRSR